MLTSTVSSRKPQIMHFRRSRWALAASFLASAGLSLLGLDGLTSGHYHVEHGSLMHHRHLYGGAHHHVPGGGTELAAHDRHEHHETDGHHPRDEPGDDNPRRGGGSTVSTLVLADSLVASPAIVVALGLERARAPLATPRVESAQSRFLPFEGPRPPPASAV